MRCSTSISRGDRLGTGASLQWMEGPRKERRREGKREGGQIASISEVAF
jgi:hypothetical protein